MRSLEVDFEALDGGGSYVAEHRRSPDHCPQGDPGFVVGGFPMVVPWLVLRCGLAVGVRGGFVVMYLNVLLPVSIDLKVVEPKNIFVSAGFEVLVLVRLTCVPACSILA